MKLISRQAKEATEADEATRLMSQQTNEANEPMRPRRPIKPRPTKLMTPKRPTRLMKSLLEYLTAACKALSLAKAKGKGDNGLESGL
jgi:hypothetical protein